MPKLPVLGNRCVVSTIPKDYCQKHRYDRGVWANKDSIRRRIDPLNIDTGGVQPPRIIRRQFKFVKVTIRDNTPHQHYWRQIKIDSNYGSIGTYDQYASDVYKMTASDRIRLEYKR